MTEARVRHQYNRWAAIYDQRWHRYVTETLAFLKTWVNLSPTDILLDVGCGTGEFERLILAENSTQRMVGVDISDQMLGVANRKLGTFPTVSFQMANGSTLPFTDHCFDVVISASAFHYFEDPIAALKEMKRVLKADGRVVILDWCRDFWVCQVCDILLKIVDPAHRHCYRQREFHQLLTTAGFQIEAAQRRRFGWIWGMMIATGVRASFNHHRSLPTT